MQEEVENRTVNLAISTTKLTFRTIVNGYNAWKRHHQAKVAQKTAQLPVGKQSIHSCLTCCARKRMMFTAADCRCMCAA